MEHPLDYERGLARSGVPQEHLCLSQANAGKCWLQGLNLFQNAPGKALPQGNCPQIPLGSPVEALAQSTAHGSTNLCQVGLHGYYLVSGWEEEKGSSSTSSL